MLYLNFIDSKEIEKYSTEQLMKLTPCLVKLMKCLEHCMISGYSRTNDVCLVI